MANYHNGRLIVEATEFDISCEHLNGYTANEINPVTGGYINYLSGTQLAKSIGNTDKTTRPQSLHPLLKRSLGDGFTTRPGVYKNSSGAYTNLNLWTTDQSVIYTAS